MKIKKETRGRKRLPPEKRKAPQATVKINNYILPFVQELKGYLKKEGITESTLSQLFSVLHGTSEQQSSVFNDPDAVSIVQSLQDKIKRLDAEKQISENKLALQEKRGLELVSERDKEHLRAMQVEGKLNSLKSSYRMLKRDYDDLLHKEYDCMAIKGNGERCTKKAVVESIQNKIRIHVCRQHAKMFKE